MSHTLRHAIISDLEETARRMEARAGLTREGLSAEAAKVLSRLKFSPADVPIHRVWDQLGTSSFALRDAWTEHEILAEGFRDAGKLRLGVTGASPADTDYVTLWVTDDGDEIWVGQAL